MELKHKTIFESSVCAGACKYHLFIIIILITILSFASYCTIRFFARGYICLFEKKSFHYYVKVVIFIAHSKKFFAFIKND